MAYMAQEECALCAKSGHSNPVGPMSTLRQKRTYKIVGGSGGKVQRLQNACAFRSLELRGCDCGKADQGAGLILTGSL
jgi:hypothetical protein